MQSASLRVSFGLVVLHPLCPLAVQAVAVQRDAQYPKGLFFIVMNLNYFFYMLYFRLQGKNNFDIYKKYFKN